jgi:hypothetical protein
MEAKRLHETRVRFVWYIMSLIAILNIIVNTRHRLVHLVEDSIFVLT